MDAIREYAQTVDTIARTIENALDAGRLRRRFPEDPEMWVSTETIYQSLVRAVPGRAQA